jgi:hypothetical protein
MTGEPTDVIVDRVIEALAPLGFEPVVTDSSGNEPCASYPLGDGRWLDITAKVSEP